MPSPAPPPPPPANAAKEPATKATKAAAPAPPADPSIPPAAGKPAVKKAAKKPLKAIYLRARSYPLHNPYQNLKVPTSGAVKIDVDSWVEAQLLAGVVYEVEG